VIGLAYSSSLISAALLRPSSTPGKINWTQNLPGSGLVEKRALGSAMGAGWDWGHRRCCVGFNRSPGRARSAMSA
jgi:hypothetical protein